MSVCLSSFFFVHYLYLFLLQYVSDGYFWRFFKNLHSHFIFLITLTVIINSFFSDPIVQIVSKINLIQMCYNSWANVCHRNGWVEDTKSIVNIDKFRSQLEASYVSNQTKEILYNERVCPWKTIYMRVCII